MLSKFNPAKYQHYLSQLPKIELAATDVQTYFYPSTFKSALIDAINQAKQRIYLVALYLEQDHAGQLVLDSLYQAKSRHPQLDIAVLVDWHRAQRGRIGSVAQQTNADWYYQIKQHYPGIEIPIYGIPINTREALGVLHLKGFIIDDRVIYSGASINEVYLHYDKKYRYDRYHQFANQQLANVMVNYIKTHLLPANAVNRLDYSLRPTTLEIKAKIKVFRQQLKQTKYAFKTSANKDQLAITPLIGLGKNNPLNKTIFYLLNSAQQHITLSTPYFNLPTQLVKSLTRALKRGIPVEIIVGDKTASDFYIPSSEPFKIIGALPYLYEINLRRFTQRLQRFIEQGLLTIRIWRNETNSFHLKGIWVDSQWLLVTGSNLNPRAWRLDMENALLIHDPQQELNNQCQQELQIIRQHTTQVMYYKELESLQYYPLKVRKLLKRLRRTRLDKLISKIL